MPLIQPLTKYTTTAQAIASYNYTDVEDGTGSVIYYACGQNLNSGVTRFLSKELIESGGSSDEIRIPQNAEYDFDLAAFNVPKTATGIVTVTAQTFSGATSTGMEVQVKHWDGSTETDISSKLVASGITATTDRLTLRLPITETVFAVGDVLRITIKATGGDAGARVWLTTATTTLKAVVQYKLEI